MTNLIEADTELPNNLSAEQALIACCLLGDNSDAYDSISSLVQADDFYALRHQLAYQAIADLAGSGEPIDEINLVERLKVNNCIDEVGGVVGVMALADGVETTASVRNYASIVKEKSNLRKMHRAYKMAAERAASEQLDSSEIQGYIDGELSLVNGSESGVEKISNSVELLKEEFKQMQEGTYVKDVVKTHIKHLDEKLGMGGIGAGEVCIVAAPTSCGKSAVAINIALRASKIDSVPSAIFSFEMPQKQIARRMLQTLSGVNLRQVEENVATPAKLKSVHAATELLDGLPIYTVHSVKGADDLRSQIRLLVRTHGVKLVVIDYLQLIPFGKSVGKTEGISNISHKIKQIAVELGIGILLLAQVNREGAKRESGLSLYDLKDSGDIENDADAVVLMWPEGGDVESAKKFDSVGPYTELQYSVAKNREGERDVRGIFKLYHCVGIIK
jgi:replicative DNA helicase